MNNEFKVFTFNMNPFRALALGGHPWFVAKDVAALLNFPQPLAAVALHCKGSEAHTHHASVGNTVYTIIHLIDLENLAAHSELQNKAVFLEVVRGSVVPQICPPKPWVLEVAEPVTFQVPPPVAAHSPSFALVTLQGGEAFTSTLAIAHGTANEHASVIQQVRKYRADLKEFGEVRFEIEPGYHNAPVEFALLNEQQATLLMTYMRNSDIVRDFKKRLVKAFWELSRRAAVGPQVPQTLTEALRLALDLEERRATLECKVQDQQSTIHAMEPKAAFYDAVAITANSRTIEEVSKAFGSGLVRFYEWLRGEKIMLRNNREHLPYQEFLDRGYFEVKEGTFDVRAKSGLMEKRTYIKTMVTTKGQLWLHKRFTKQVEA